MPMPTARARMLDLAVAGEPGLKVDRRELRREGPSYTVDTLRELRAELGPHEPIVWMLGGDSLLQLDTWHRWQELFEYAHVLAVARPGSHLDADTDRRAGRRAVHAEVAPRWRECAGAGASPCRRLRGVRTAPAATRIVHRATPSHRRRRGLAGLGAGARSPNTSAATACTPSGTSHRLRYNLQDTPAPRATAP